MEVTTCRNPLPTWRKPPSSDAVNVSSIFARHNTDRIWATSSGDNSTEVGDVRLAVGVVVDGVGNIELWLVDSYLLEIKISVKFELNECICVAKNWGIQAFPEIPKHFQNFQICLGICRNFRQFHKILGNWGYAWFPQICKILNDHHARSPSLYSFRNFQKKLPHFPSNWFGY